MALQGQQNWGSTAPSNDFVGGRAAPPPPNDRISSKSTLTQETCQSNI